MPTRGKAHGSLTARPAACRFLWVWVLAAAFSAVSCASVARGTPGYCRTRHAYCTTACWSWGSPGEYRRCISACAMVRYDCLDALQTPPGDGD